MRALTAGLVLCLAGASRPGAVELSAEKARPTPAAVAPAPAAERTGGLYARVRERFPEWYREGVELFWEPGDAPLPPELLGEADPAEVFAFFRSTGPVFPARDAGCRCAVVGASRNLLGSGYGPEIDDHDVVLRINLAPTRGFEGDVGRRTTHYVVTQWIIGAVVEGKRRENVSADLDGRLASLAEDAWWLLLYRPFDEARPSQELIENVRALARSPGHVPRDRSRLVHPQLTLHASEWTGQSPSTGLVGVILAVRVCDAVDVYGFGPDALGLRGYYYKPGIHEEHGPDDEEAALRRLAAASVITLHGGPAPGNPPGQ
jgi:hypothetical protein